MATWFAKKINSYDTYFKEVFFLIHLENISKTFKVATRGASTKDVIKSFFKKDYKEVHALTDVSLDIKEGEIVRIHRPKRCRQVHNDKDNVWHTCSK